MRGEEDRSKFRYGISDKHASGARNCVVSSSLRSSPPLTWLVSGLGVMMSVAPLLTFLPFLSSAMHVKQWSDGTIFASFMLLRRSKRIAKGVGMMGENYCGGNGGGASYTGVRACAVFVACDCVVSLLLRSSSASHLSTQQRW